MLAPEQPLILLPVPLQVRKSRFSPDEMLLESSTLSIKKLYGRPILYRIFIDNSQIWRGRLCFRNKRPTGKSHSSNEHEDTNKTHLSLICNKTSIQQDEHCRGDAAGTINSTRDGSQGSLQDANFCNLPNMLH